MRYFICSIFVVLSSTYVSAQLDSIQQLEAVYLVDNKLKNNSEGYRIQTIQDSTLIANSFSLTNILQNTSTLYIRENGFGGVASASLRGTNAAQTAVIWNGIPINSQLTGQTDFTTLLSSGYDKVDIRYGGGSTQYGSGAIGGSIHLTNAIQFKDEQEFELQSAYGSYSTFSGLIKAKKSSQNYTVDASIAGISSENDYEYIGFDRNNENGNFKHYNINANGGLQLGSHRFSFHSAYFKGDRNFSGTLSVTNTDGYIDETARNLVTWNYKSGLWTSTAKAAHLHERYQYFPDKEAGFYVQGKTNTYLFEQQSDYQVSSALRMTGIVNFTAIRADGTNIGNNKRNTLAAVVLAKHRVSKNFTYGINLRQEFLNDFDNPFLVAIDGLFKLNPKHSLSVNGSKNYRIPTFNDLFWNAGGNTNLQPETSYQGEIGYKFTSRNFDIGLNTFYIASKDQIKWQPNSIGVWQPVNISESRNYGVEINAQLVHNFGKHYIKFAGNYAYTKAIDLERDTQLIYVPFHKGTGNLTYTFKRFSASWQTIYVGEVFITTDNKGTIPNYTITNLGGSYTFGSDKTPLTLGFNVNNLFNTYYENVAFRPMPNINYQCYINLKF